VITAPLRKTVSQIVNIEPGKESSISLSLAIDPDAVGVVVAQVHTSFRGNNHASVLRQAARLIQLGIQDSDMLGEMAVSFLETGDYLRFRDTDREALSLGDIYVSA
jgi:hypothetical protein